MDHFAERGPALLFYVNTPSLVVGKNQNPWREAATDWLRERGVPIGRRISGGGTVYHDEGNLNFALIVPRASYRKSEIFEKTLAALRALGLPVALMADNNSIALSGKKISGTAFCFRGQAAMHHGTILVHSQLELLRRALVPAISDVETRAIASNRTSVANVYESAPHLTVEAVAGSLAQHLAGARAWEVAVEPDDDLFRTLAARHREWDWVFGHTPVFTWRLNAHGDIQRITVERGVIVRAEPETAQARRWIGSRFDVASGGPFFCPGV